MQEIKIVPNTQPQTKPDENQLGFGRYFTDHMFVMDYTEGIGWHDPSIVPYGPIPMEPTMMVFHYAQETFEGMKAYRHADGKIVLFRPYMNAKRHNNSNARLCIPSIPEDDYVYYIKEFVKYEQDWVPHLPETSLYIRPFVFATELGVGVHPAKTYKFVVVLSPSGNYYAEGVNPVKIMVEDELVRAVIGGTGFTKCGGNYAASILAQKRAEEAGYSQVLWLDGVHRKYVEEVGTMNIMFKIDGEVITAPCEGSVLPGITRDSILHVLRDWGIKATERHLPTDAAMAAAHARKLEEVFGTGTAAVISPVGELKYKDKVAVINDFKTGSLTQKLYDYLTGIQWGKVADKYGWLYPVD